MYSPTMRLLTVLELLQSYRHMSGPEIARRLEVDVRTVRRYIVILQDMGIPVEAERGPAGSYQLQRGRRLPPLMFTDSEAVAITLGLLAIREFHFPVNVAAVEGALVKTERVLPENVLLQARSLQEAITFNVSSSYYMPQPPAFLQNDVIVTLSYAVQQKQRVHLRYRSGSEAESQRDFDPYGIVFNEGYWYTAGYCHLRQDLRTFRLDRITKLDTSNHTFERPADFDLLSYVMSSIVLAPSGHQVEVILQTTLEQAQTVIPPIMGTLEESEEGVIFRRNAAQLEWVAYVLMSVDFPVIIKQPDELREVLRSIAAKASQLAEK